MSLCSHLYTPIELLLCEEFFELKVLHGYREVLILLARCFNYLVLLMSSRKDGGALSKFVFPLFIVSIDVPLWSLMNFVRYCSGSPGYQCCVVALLV